MATKKKNRPPQKKVVVVQNKMSPALVVSMVGLIAVLTMLAIYLMIKSFGGDGAVAETPVSGVVPASMVEKVNAADRQVGSATHPSGAVYIGQKNCVPCHQDKANKMAQVAMSHAIDRVVNSVDVPNAISNPSCLGCHVTGFGKARAAGVTAADMVNVQCEACHGPGSRYIELMKKGYKASDPSLAKQAADMGLVAKPNKDNTCFNCHHDEPGQAPWDYQQHREIIRHWDGP